MSSFKDGTRRCSSEECSYPATSRKSVKVIEHHSRAQQPNPSADVEPISPEEVFTSIRITIVVELSEID